MQDSRLPIELCERVIDFCANEYYLRHRYPTLRACALTCTAWVPRSRCALLYDLRFRTELQVEHFVDIIKEHRDWAEYICILHITPAQALEHGYLAFGSLLHQLKESNVRALTLWLRQLDWRIFPPRYHTVLESFGKDTVRILVISNMIFANAAELVHLVLSLTGLREFHCRLVKFVRASPPVQCARAITQASRKRQKTPSNIHSVSLSSIDDFPPLLEVLGAEVISLFLHYPEASWPWENLCECISSYSNLQYITLSLWVGSTDTKVFLDDAYRYTSFEESARRFLDIMRRLSSCRMHSVALRLAPCLIPLPDEGLLSFSYLSSRLQAIDALFGDVKWLFDTLEPLSRLHTLNLSVLENSIYHDAEWWCQVLRKRLPNAPQVIQVDVEYFHMFIGVGTITQNFGCQSKE
ncbi:hypothetical protein C8Q79DRAFT_1014918 [Trametes meyenii]|nr:hypothetical protein C8Q79DRAFT_1014918 [Trametes meyenii]